MGDGGDALGTMATGALLAHEIEQARIESPAVGHAADEPCANCGTERVGPYCYACGQTGHVHRSLGALVHDIAHGVFHFEGKLWHTLPLLAWRPGELTRRYVMGERAKFVSPMALFLFSVFLMFAVVSSLAGHGREGGVGAQLRAGTRLAQKQTALAEAQARLARITDPERRAEAAAAIADRQREIAALEAEQRPGARGPTSPAEAPGASSPLNVNTGWRWLDASINHAADNPDLVLYKMKSYGYKYSWALIPISMPFLWLLFAFRRDVGLYDHAIFSTYSLSFMSLAVVALSLLGRIGLPTGLVVLAVLIVPPVHMYRQLKGAYRLGRWGAGWRTAALLLITAITSALFLAFVFYMGSD